MGHGTRHFGRATRSAGPDRRGRSVADDRGGAGHRADRTGRHGTGSRLPSRRLTRAHNQARDRLSNGAPIRRQGTVLQSLVVPLRWPPKSRRPQGQVTLGSRTPPPRVTRQAAQHRTGCTRGLAPIQNSCRRPRQRRTSIMCPGRGGCSPGPPCPGLCRNRIVVGEQGAQGSVGIGQERRATW